MLRNLRTSLAYKSLKPTIYKQGSIFSYQSYSTLDHDTETPKPETPKEDTTEKNFWEIEPTEKTIETPQSVKHTQNRVSSSTQEFSRLLSELFSREPPKPKAKGKSTIKSDMMIEKKLLEMVLTNRKPYKEKAPLPRSMMAPLYGKSADKLDRARAAEENEEDSIFNFLIPKSDEEEKNWNMKDVSQNKRIQLKQKEMEIIQKIVETKSDIELLETVQKEVDQKEYQIYYPKVIGKAIEHAAKRDPYLALTLFEMTKNKSVESYIFGCTTHVYNTLLLLRWHTWRDLYGMLDLVEEMKVNGIEFDSDSRRIIREAVNGVQLDGDHPLERQTNQFWNSDEIRNCNIMKEIAGKWSLSQ